MPPSAKVAARLLRDEWQPPGAADVSPLATPHRAGEGEYRAQLFSRIADIDAATWDALAGGAVTRSHAYLRAVERFELGDCTNYFLLMHDDGDRPVGLACVYVLDTDFAQLMPAWLARVIHAARRWWPRLMKARITECGVPLASGNGVVVREGCCRVRAYRCVERTLRCLAADVGSSLLVMRDFRDDDREDLGFMLTLGYKCVSNLPYSSLPLPWSHYDAYVTGMRARYRSDLKRRLRRAAAGGRTVESVAGFARFADVWARQAAFVYEHSRGFKREALNPAYYRALEQELGDQVEVVAVRDGADYVAHGVVLHDAERTTATFFGREPGPPAGEWILLMNEVIRAAIARGSDTLVLGLGSYEAKSLIGAVFEDQYVYTCCTNPLLNAVIRLVPDLMQLSPPVRRVFRVRSAVA